MAWGLGHNKLSSTFSVKYSIRGKRCRHQHEEDSWEILKGRFLVRSPLNWVLLLFYICWRLYTAGLPHEWRLSRNRERVLGGLITQSETRLVKLNSASMYRSLSILQNVSQEDRITVLPALRLALCSSPPPPLLPPPPGYRKIHLLVWVELRLITTSCYGMLSSLGELVAVTTFSHALEGGWCFAGWTPERF